MKFHWPLYSDIIFFVDHYSAGVSNKHCLLSFLHWYCFITQHAYALCNGLKGCKNDIFVDKICAIFLIFAQNTDRGYTLLPYQCGGSIENPQSMF